MIPKIFHQIWVNRTAPELPEAYRVYRDTWRALHPDWDFRLWNLANLGFTPRRPDLLRSAANYAQISDLLRYEILLRHGGVYLDTDFECRRSLAPILAGVRNFACSEDGRSISIGILGAAPGSVYMERCLAALPARCGAAETQKETGPAFFTRVLLDGGIAGDFTLFPRAWFYPYNWNEPHRAHEAFPSAYAVHRWAHSWREPDTRWLARLARKFRRPGPGLGAGG
jgi:mannosyltransferase OCH1-like enzyme